MLETKGSFQEGDWITFIEMLPRGYGSKTTEGVWIEGLVVEINPDAQTVSIQTTREVKPIHVVKLVNLSNVKIISSDKRGEWNSYQTTIRKKAACMSTPIQKKIEELCRQNDITFEQLPDGVPFENHKGSDKLEEGSLKFFLRNNEDLEHIAELLFMSMRRSGVNCNHLVYRKTLDVIAIPGNLINKKEEFIAYCLFFWTDRKHRKNRKVFQVGQEVRAKGDFEIKLSKRAFIKIKENEVGIITASSDHENSYPVTFGNVTLYIHKSNIKSLNE